MPTSITAQTRFFTEAQLNTDPLIHTEENQHALGSKTGLIYSLFFQEREHMHLEKQTQSHPAMIHMLSNPQCTHRKPPYAQVLQKVFDKCVYFHKNTLYVKYKVFLILLYNRSLM